MASSHPHSCRGLAELCPGARWHPWTLSGHPVAAACHLLAHDILSQMQRRRNRQIIHAVDSSPTEVGSSSSQGCRARRLHRRFSCTVQEALVDDRCLCHSQRCIACPCCTACTWYWRCLLKTPFDPRDAQTYSVPPHVLESPDVQHKISGAYNHTVRKLHAAALQLQACCPKTVQVWD